MNSLIRDAYVLILSDSRPVTNIVVIGVGLSLQLFAYYEDDLMLDYDIGIKEYLMKAYNNA